MSQHVEKEVATLWQQTLPMLPSCLFEVMRAEVKLIHLNVCNLKKKIKDVRVDDIMKRANMLSLNETHLSGDDHLSVDMLMLPDGMVMVRSDHSTFGVGVALLIGNHLHPKKLTILSTCEIAAGTMDQPFELLLLSVYCSPTTPVADFTAQMLKTISRFKTASMCIIGDFNEDVSKMANTYCYSLLQQHGLKEVNTKPTQDSGTVIDHIYITPDIQAVTDVSDCYCSDHDYVLVWYIFKFAKCTLIGHVSTQ